MALAYFLLGQNENFSAPPQHLVEQYFDLELFQFLSWFNTEHFLFLVFIEQ